MPTPSLDDLPSAGAFVVAHVWLGNPAVVESLPARNPDGTPQVTPQGHEVKVRTPAPAGTWTHVERIPGHSVSMLVADITRPGGIWDLHSDHPGPTWVASDDPALARALSIILECPVADIPTEALAN